MFNHAAATIAAIGVALTASTASYAQAPAPDPTVSFTQIADAVPGRWIDAATTAPSPTVPNRLSLGFNSGYDPATFRTNAFVASTTAFHYPNAMDTLRFVITAPAGYYISKLNYAQRGTNTFSRIGKAAGGTQWVVGDTPADIGLFGTNGALNGSIDLKDKFKTVVPVSITIGMHAFAAPGVGAATISVTGADVDVEVLPLPSTLLLGQ